MTGRSSAALSDNVPLGQPSLKQSCMVSALPSLKMSVHTGRETACMRVCVCEREACRSSDMPVPTGNIYVAI